MEWKIQFVRIPSTDADPEIDYRAVAIATEDRPDGKPWACFVEGRRENIDELIDAEIHRMETDVVPNYKTDPAPTNPPAKASRTVTI
tara:strand:+ start:329 stop:589 length:261 start_codon:yes stop_codon:yes gene_type:complete